MPQAATVDEHAEALRVAKIVRAVANRAPRHENECLAIRPVVAELGHELMSSAIVRRESRDFGKTYVWTRPGREVFYEDFAEVRTHSIVCEGCTIGGYVTRDGRWHGVDPSLDRSLVPPSSTIRHLPYFTSKSHAEFRVFGKESADWCGVTVFHARSRNHVVMRNWPESNWQKLAGELRKRGLAGRIVCIGSPDAARCIPECEDARGLSLAEQMGALRSARWCIGPSSGPMHIAQHCKCPTVVWCGGGEQERTEVVWRYRKDWNPFAAPSFATTYASWQPSVDKVVSWAEAFFDWLGDPCRETDKRMQGLIAENE